MTTTKFQLGSILVVTSLVALLLTLGILLSSNPCLEDQDCWDCTTMGNRICGG